MKPHATEHKKMVFRLNDARCLREHNQTAAFTGSGKPVRRGKAAHNALEEALRRVEGLFSLGRELSWRLSGFRELDLEV